MRERSPKKPLLKPPVKVRGLIKVKYILDNPIPSEIPKGVLLVVGVKNKYSKWAYIKCPSDCGDTLMLSLQKGDNPRWRLSIDKNNLPTLHPSIWKTDGCQSHFLLRKGRIINVKGRFYQALGLRAPKDKID